jgi:hypothetical protein
VESFDSRLEHLVPLLAGLIRIYYSWGSWNPSRLGVLRVARGAPLVRAPPKCLYHPVLLNGNLK